MSLKINVRFDNRALFARLGPQADQKLAYAMVNALNKTALEIQRAERQRVLGEFDVRQRAFISREAAKIERENFANVRKGRAFVEIGIGQKARLLLSTFEAGGVRYPFFGSHVALPVIGSPARRTRRSRVPSALTFEQLAFHKGKGDGVWIGGNRTYLIEGVGVFQRGVARKTKKSRQKTTRHDSVMIYAFHDPFPLRARLEWVRTARRIANVALSRHLEDEATKAVLRARSVV